MEFHFIIPTQKEIKKLLVAFLFFGNIAAIFNIWWLGSNYYILNPGAGYFLVALGRITGLLGEYLLLIQLLLIGRIRLIENLFGFDKLSRFHHWIGYAVISLLLAHPVFLVVGRAQMNEVPYISQFAEFLAGQLNILWAFFGLLLLIFIVFLSIKITRKKLSYELWYVVHLLSYLAIGLVLGHQLGAADLQKGWPLYYWYALNFLIFGLFILYRFMRPLYLFYKHSFFIENVVQETKDVWSLHISGKNMENFIFEAGQYANIMILASGMRYSHPFSFSAAYNGKTIRFTIKNLGDYSSKIGTVMPGTNVIIDGPLGLFTEKRATRDKFLFIAGGIGVTPVRAMIESLISKNKNIVLLSGNKTEDDIVFKEEFKNCCDQIPFVSVYDVLATPTPGYESGFIDKEKISRLCPDFFEREVFLCGPPPMMKATVKNLKELGFEDRYIHFENFSF